MLHIYVSSSVAAFVMQYTKLFVPNS